MRYHIVKLNCLPYSGSSHSSGLSLEGAYSSSFHALQKEGTLLFGDVPNGGLFLVQESSLLSWMVSHPIYHKEIQVSVFSLQDAEGQLAFAGAVRDCGKLESYQIAKTAT